MPARKNARATPSTEKKAAPAKPSAKVALKTARKATPLKAPSKALKTATTPVAATTKSTPTLPTSRADKTIIVSSEPSATVKAKAKRVKLVRDSFTMPETEYAVLADVKKSCIKAGFAVKKSELLRVGVALLRSLDLPSLKLQLTGLPSIKAGRPKK